MNPSDVVLKRIDFALSSLHFTIWLPVIVAAGVGTVAAIFTISGLSPAGETSATTLLAAFLSVFTFLLNERIHLRQRALWRLYTFIALNTSQVDKLHYEELLPLEDRVADIQKQWHVREGFYNRAVQQFIDACCPQPSTP